MGGAVSVIATTVMVVFVLFVFGISADVSGQGRRTREKEAPPPSPQTIDKRDRIVTAPATIFHRRPYWQVLGQCGGGYFKLNTLYADAAAHAQVVKRDANAAKALTQSGESARRTASAFLNAAERVLMEDRKIGRAEAVLTYDPAASEAGDRLKSVEAARDAVKSCPALYRACHSDLPKICDEAPPEG
jgi:hypothetical protein